MAVTRRSVLGSLVVGAVAAPRLFAQSPPPPPAPTGRPWERDLLVRRSMDGGDSFGPAGVFEPASGVPSLLRDLRGRLYSAFQWFPQGSPHFDRVAVRVSEDNGHTWTAPQPIVVSGLPVEHQRPFDPTLALLPDGRIRIYFSSSPRPVRMLDASVATYSALSEDGVHYTFEPDPRFTVAGRIVIDPAAVRTGDRWHLTAPIGAPADGAYHAISRDGLTFVRRADIPAVLDCNWTGNLMEHGRGLRFYGSAPSGLWWADSEDGDHWSAPHPLGIRGGDPAVVEAADGSVLLVYVS